MLSFLVLLVSLTSAAAVAFRPYNTTSGQQRGVVNVHLLAHSHDDVGWLKAPHEYFLGSRVLGLDPGGSGLSVYYANGAVQFILTSVVDALSANPDRRFVVVEQWFFQRWWNQQGSEVQQRVRALVASKQLVFANGGLVMHDEAGPIFGDMLDQTSAGIRWIAATFGADALPRVTSQLDPFGHSATQASMLASPLSGYIAQFQARMDEQEGALRSRTKTLDFAWAPSSSLGLSALTLGSLGSTGYSTPDGFCFDIGVECQAESAAVYSPSGLNNPINDDSFRGLPDAVDDNVLAFVAQVQKTVAGMRGSYTQDADGTVNLPWTMGDDFDFGAAAMNFASLDKLIHYVNLNTTLHGINMFYSTQADYAAARLSAEAPLALKTCDGFPYASDPHQVWSGYFSSRPALKAYVRDSSALFSAARLLQAWAAPPADTGFSNPLWLLETGLGVLQHHDAVAGTSKQVVAHDYARRLAAGRAAAQAAIGAYANALLAPPSGPLAWSACDLANATLCAPLEATPSYTPLALLLINAQSGVGARLRLRLPVAGAATWLVLGADGTTPVPAQLVPPSPADAALREYYGAPPLGANASWLCFVAPPTPPAGYTVIFLQPLAAPASAPSTAPSLPLPPASQLSNGLVNLTFDAATGQLSAFSSCAPGSAPGPVPLAQQLLAYTPSAQLGAASGAYVFRPNATEAAAPLLPPGASAAHAALTGPVLSEAWLQVTPWAFQRITLWAGDGDAFDVVTTLGPLPVADLFGQGMEVIARFSTGGASQGAFFTDSNAREWQPRVRNARPDYNLTLTEPIAMNYYPVNTAIRVAAGAGATLTVLTDRTEGGASLADGEVELMLHRRLTHDDDKGVFEALDERGVDGKGLRVAVTHRVLVSAAGAPAARAHRAALQAVLLPPVWQVAPLPMGPAAWAAALRPGAANASLLTPSALPPNVQLLTLHAWNTSAALLRLAHVYEAGEDAGAGGGSSNATVALAGLFFPPLLQLKGAVEYTLTGGQPLADVEPVTYRLQGGGAVTLPVVPPPPSGPGMEVTLAPMQVRTFLVSF